MENTLNNQAIVAEDLTKYFGEGPTRMTAVKEHLLNAQESLIIAAENILLYAKINFRFAEDIKAAVPKEYEGLK